MYVRRRSGYRRPTPLSRSMSLRSPGIHCCLWRTVWQAFHTIGDGVASTRFLTLSVIKADECRNSGASSVADALGQAAHVRGTASFRRVRVGLAVEWSSSLWLRCGTPRVRGGSAAAVGTGGLGW
jgi:hypothetical protein